MKLFYKHGVSAHNAISMLVQEDFVALLFFVVAWYGFRVVDGKRYSSTRTNESESIEFFMKVDATIGKYTGIFGPVWLVLYGLLAGAQFIYWRDGPSGTGSYSWVMGLYVVNLILNKLWTPVFFGQQKPWLALVILLGTFVSALVIAILTGIAAREACANEDSVNPGLLWLSFAFVLLYTLWLAIASCLNYEVCMYDPKKPRYVKQATRESWYTIDM